MLLLFGRRWRGHVDIDLLAPSEESSAKHEERNQHNDYKDHQHRDNTCAAAAITITHNPDPPSKVYPLSDLGE
jgi:hypothetical protein